MQFDYTVRTQLREDIKLLIPALRKRLKIKKKIQIFKPSLAADNET